MTKACTGLLFPPSCYPSLTELRKRKKLKERGALGMICIL